jgi:AraC-like DNA-binding protein
LAYIERHLADPDLDVAKIGAGVGISVRYLHRCFADVGASVRETVLRRRLTLCHEKLADPKFDLVRISDLARRYGFVSQSHFAASFRKAFEQTPSEVRNEAARLRQRKES